MLLEEIYKEIGIELTKAGKLWKATCPFHNEDTPSFFVYKDQTFHCFGCGAHGTYAQCKEKLGFIDSKEVKFGKHADEIQENDLLDLENKKISLEEKLICILDKKGYNIRERTWELFDTIWLDLNFMDNSNIINLNVFINKKYKEIVEEIQIQGE